jgi:hypothetical protein
LRLATAQGDDVDAGGAKRGRERRAKAASTHEGDSARRTRRGGGGRVPFQFPHEEIPVGVVKKREKSSPFRSGAVTAV